MKDEIERLTNIWEVIMDGLKHTARDDKVAIYEKQLEQVEKLIFLAFVDEVEK